MKYGVVKAKSISSKPAAYHIQGSLGVFSLTSYLRDNLRQGSTLGSGYTHYMLPLTFLTKGSS